MRQPTSVLVYPFRRAQREVLLLRRVARPDLDLDAFWQGVTGALEGEETIIQAAARELHEETGYTAKLLEEIGFSYSFPVRERQRRMFAADVHEIIEHVLVAVIDANFEPRLSAEHDEWRWCDIGNAVELLHWPNNIEAFRRCCARID